MNNIMPCFRTKNQVEQKENFEQNNALNKKGMFKAFSTIKNKRNEKMCGRLLRSW